MISYYCVAVTYGLTQLQKSSPIAVMVFQMIFVKDFFSFFPQRPHLFFVVYLLLSFVCSQYYTSIQIFKILLFFPLPGTHLLFINIYILYHSYHFKQRTVSATGLGASSLKLHRELYIIHLLDLVDIMYNLEINYYYCCCCCCCCSITR